ncbi:MAG: GNAT family N-acetyltransferase [Flavobacteriales bacterium]
MAIEIREIPSNDQKALFELAKSVGNNFVSEDWMSTNGNTLPIGIFANSDLIGGAILGKASLKGVSALLNVHGMPSLGLFVAPEVFKNPNMKVSERDISKALESWLSSRKEKIKLIRFSPNFNDLLPLYWSGFILQTKYTYQIDLSLSKDELWGQLNSKLKSGIKKVQEKGLEYSETRIDDAKELILIANSGLNTKALDLINLTLDQLSNSSHTALCTLSEQGSPVAAACTYISDGNMYYLFGGANKEKSGYGAAMIWERMLKAREMGLKKFDFEGSMIPGVEKFFRQFGGDLCTYQTATQAPLHFEILMKLLNKR